MKIYLIAAAIALLSTTVACNKSGTLQTEVGILQAHVTSYWTDQDAMAALTINNTLMIDSMGIVRNAVNGVADRAEGKQRLQLKNLRTGDFWLDTLLDIPDQFLSITLLQLESGGRPVLVNKEEISPDVRNIGFSYADPELPSSMILELFAVKMNGQTVVSGMDVPIAVYNNLRRGVFTGFLPINISVFTENANRFVYKLKDAATNEYLPNAGILDPARFRSGGRMVASNPTYLTGNNHIFSIKRTPPTPNYSSARIVAY